jgi:hypothetical protein
MCLITDQKKWLKAEEDIVCYKLLQKGNYDLCGRKCFFRTPYRWYYLSDSIISGKCCLRAFSILPDFHSSPWKSFREINRGAIHAFIDKDAAKAHMSYYCNTLFECIIPKGTKYAIGTDSDICAKKIKFVKPIIELLYPL